MTIDGKARLSRIEAILRDYGMHEPSCPARAVDKANAQGFSYYLPQPCECWLSELDEGLSA